MKTEDLNRKLRLQTAIVRRERAKASALIASIGEGLIATDSSGKIVQVNQVALDILGYKRVDLIGSWFPEKVIAQNEDGTVLDRLDRPATRVFITGESITQNLYYVTDYGNRVPVSVTVSPIFFRNKPIGTIEIFRDITKELAADRMKSEFISLASHQLRTPLSTISLYSNMLKDGYGGELTKDQSSLLDRVLSATTRMNELIDGLLQITRLESDNIMIESKPTNVTELCVKLLKESAPTIRSKDLKLLTKIDKDIPYINTDSIVLGEILNNLITNAIKYTPDNGTITIYLTKSKSLLKFMIKDTGYGIPLDSQGLIFTKFYRASNVGKHDVSGTGLGLYFTKLLAEKINGKVWFKSREDVGTNFFFTMPLQGSISKKGNYRLSDSRISNN